MTNTPCIDSAEARRLSHRVLQHFPWRSASHRARWSSCAWSFSAWLVSCLPGDPSAGSRSCHHARELLNGAGAVQCAPLRPSPCAGLGGWRPVRLQAVGHYGRIRQTGRHRRRQRWQCCLFPTAPHALPGAIRTESCWPTSQTRSASIWHWAQTLFKRPPAGSLVNSTSPSGRAEMTKKATGWSRRHSHLCSPLLESCVCLTELTDSKRPSGTVTKATAKNTHTHTRMHVHNTLIETHTDKERERFRCTVWLET